MKLVIFDIDGTLVDSQHMICAAMHKAFTNQGLICPPRDDLLAIVGLSLPEAFTRLGAGDAGFPVASLVDRYKEAFFELRGAGTHPEQLYPGARQAVEQLAARDDVILGVATGKSQRGVRIVLGKHDLLHHFTTIQTADDAPSKPHPGMVIAAMREAGARPADTVMIGDSVYDMEMARAAGAGAIGVSWGYHGPDALRHAGAQCLVDGFPELVAALDDLCGMGAAVADAIEA